MTYLIYIDDSGDKVLSVFCALVIPIDTWNTCLQKIKDIRHNMQMSDGIFVNVELHAWKFVSGRGEIADHVVSKGRRCEIFKHILQQVTTLPGVRLFGVAFPARLKTEAYGTLIRSINRTLQEQDGYAILICDEGDDINYTKLVRYLQTLETGAINRIIEDPFFKKSEQSYFIQLSDFCAYALLRQEHPIASKTKYGLDAAFDLLEPISEGIIRPD